MATMEVRTSPTNRPPFRPVDSPAAPPVPPLQLITERRNEFPIFLSDAFQFNNSFVAASLQAAEQHVEEHQEEQEEQEEEEGRQHHHHICDLQQIGISHQVRDRPPPDLCSAFFYRRSPKPTSGNAPKISAVEACG